MRNKFKPNEVVILQGQYDKDQKEAVFLGYDQNPRFCFLRLVSNPDTFFGSRVSYIYKMQPTYEYEYTDTFGGEANYCWVRRGKVTANDFTHAIRKVKKELGITCRTRKVMDTGDMVRHDLVGCCQCIFINWSEDES